MASLLTTKNWDEDVPYFSLSVIYELFEKEQTELLLWHFLIYIYCNWTWFTCWTLKCLKCQERHEVPLSIGINQRSKLLVSQPDKWWFILTKRGGSVLLCLGICIVLCIQFARTEVMFLHSSLGNWIFFIFFIFYFWWLPSSQVLLFACLITPWKQFIMS
jgi:hypothetical protein